MTDETLPSAFFPVGLNVAGRLCFVIGGSDDVEAERKAVALNSCGAEVVSFEGRRPADEDMRGVFLVISTLQDERYSARLQDLARAYGFLLCCIDQPRYNSVAMQAVVVAGRARIGISTGGVSPRVGAILRSAFERALDARFGRFLERLATKRREVRAAFPEDSEARRAAMRAAADGFDAELLVRYPAWYREEM